MLGKTLPRGQSVGASRKFSRAAPFGGHLSFCPSAANWFGRCRKGPLILNLRRAAESLAHAASARIRGPLVWLRPPGKPISITIQARLCCHRTEEPRRVLHAAHKTREAKVISQVCWTALLRSETESWNRNSSETLRGTDQHHPCGAFVDTWPRGPLKAFLGRWTTGITGATPSDFNRSGGWRATPEWREGCEDDSWCSL